MSRRVQRVRCAYVFNELTSPRYMRHSHDSFGCTLQYSSSLFARLSFFYDIPAQCAVKVGKVLWRCTRARLL
jgi:hypothetical protein